MPSSNSTDRRAGPAGAAASLRARASRLAMASVYFGILTPLAFVLRAMRSDVLSRRRNPNASTYWRSVPPPPRRNTYFRQF